MAEKIALNLLLLKTSSLFLDLILFFYPCYSYIAGQVPFSLNLTKQKGLLVVITYFIFFIIRVVYLIGKIREQRLRKKITQENLREKVIANDIEIEKLRSMRLDNDIKESNLLH